MDLEMTMATVKNRQNLTLDEAAFGVEIYNSAGRLDPVKTDAANAEIFHSRNVVQVVITGSIVKDVPATLVKHKAARDLILAGLK